MTQTNRPEYCLPPLLHSPPIATAAVALLYAAVAHIGYLTTTLPGHVSPIFPSAGVALAAVLILGRPALLGVLLGSVLANGIPYIFGLPPHLSSRVSIHGGPTAVFMIGFGAMASAGAGAFLVRRLGEEQYALRSARNLLVLVTIGGLGCYTISPTVGVLALSLAGITPWKLFGYSWLTWWVGDVAGVIIVAPLILAWLHAAKWWKGLRRAGEAAFLGGVLLSLSFYVFFRGAPLEYGLLPLLLIAAFRFDMRGATATAAVVAVLATIGTSHGSSPFSRGSVNESLLLLHSFLSVNVICALLLAAVLAERKAAEDSLRESEGKFVAAFRNSPDAVYVTDGETFQFLEVNEAFEKLSGWTRAEAMGRTSQDLGLWVNPSDQERFFTTRTKEGRLRNFELPIRFRDSSLHSLEVSSEPLEFGGRRCFLTTARDITERRVAEQKLREANASLVAGLAESTRKEQEIEDLSARLIDAQEEERRRLARELHDDLSQQIGALSLAIGNLKRLIPEDRAEARAHSDRIHEKLVQVADAVRRMSHELHPAILQYSGLDAALRAYCEEFGTLTGVQISVDIQGSFESVAPAAALCLFRVTQEALRNVAKHAEVSAASVELKHAGGILQLTVSDAGVGMEPGRGEGKSGLGLLNIKERTRLVRGKVEIRSSWGQGTSVKVQVPDEPGFPRNQTP